MSAFSIDPSASEEIRRLFRLSQFSDPIAEICEITASGSLPVRGSESKAELRALAKVCAKNAAKGQERIHVIAHERAEFISMHLCEIDGITFFAPCGFFRALTDIRLAFDGERFVLLGPDNVVYTFESLAQRTL